MNFFAIEILAKSRQREIDILLRGERQLKGFQLEKQTRSVSTGSARKTGHKLPGLRLLLADFLINAGCRLKTSAERRGAAA